MKEPIRVLHITEKLQSAGIESFIMNNYRNIDREEVQFDFLVTRDQKEFYDEEIKTLGGKKYTISKDKNQNAFKRVWQESVELEKFLKEHKYNIIHVHSGTPLRILYLRAAKKAGVKVRIYHSHSAEVKGPHKAKTVKRLIFKILKQFFPIYGTDFFACSMLAAKWMYPKRILKNAKLIHNGIETDKFKFDQSIREEYRKKLNIENDFVIGHIGRFNDQKNHTFLIDIFKDLTEKNIDAKLLLIGDGELRQEIEEKVNKLELTEKIMFLGIQSDVNKILQAIDLFVLPSNYEGLPVVGIEAQAAGLKCLLSDQITKEVDITGNVEFLPITNTNIWVEKIKQSKNYKREDTSSKIMENQYDVTQVAEGLQKFYQGKEIQ